MVSANHLAVAPLFQTFSFLVFAIEKNAIIPNRLLGIIGCKMECNKYGSCSRSLYNVDVMRCSLYIEPASPDDKPRNINVDSSTFEFQVVPNSCQRHEKFLVSRRGFKSCMAFGMKIHQKTKEKRKSERTIIWETPEKICAYDYLTKKKKCRRTHWHALKAIDHETGDMYVRKHMDKMERRKVLSKRVDFKKRVSVDEFSIFNKEKIVFLYENSHELRVSTKTFKYLPCKYKAKSVYGMTVDHRQKVVVMKRQAKHDRTSFVKFDPISCKMVSKFTLKHDVVSKFIVLDENLFFCCEKGVIMVNITSKRSKTIESICSSNLIFGTPVSLLIVKEHRRYVKKFDSNGNFLKKMRIPKPNEGVLFVQFTSFSLKELLKMSIKKTN